MSRVFSKSEQFAKRVFEIKLPVAEWNLLFAVNQEITSQSLAEKLELPLSDVEAILKKFVGMKLLSEKSRRLPPSERGGRRGPRQRSSIKKLEQEKGRFSKPEIICWNEGWNWTIGIEVPEEIEVIDVINKDGQLEPVNSDDSRYCLNHTEGNVKVTWDGGEKDLQLMTSEQRYLVFKMKKNWREPGRLVRKPTVGFYLIVVPESWKRDEQISGSPPIEPESTQLDGYKAHFFYLEKNSNGLIGFISENGEQIKVELGISRFYLLGQEINDASEEMGPLFGLQPPLIGTLANYDWNNIGVIVVGEEGSGRNKWRTQFDPQPDIKEQKLPKEIENRLGGWYFVRIYDKNDSLLESMDFRFMKALKQIDIASYPFLPNANGHEPIAINFHHDRGCEIKLLKGSIEINKKEQITSAVIPNKSAWDVSEWSVKSDNASIELEIMIERIWWNLIEEHEETLLKRKDDLLDKPIVIRREFFKAASNKAIGLWLPKPQWIKEVFVGFDGTRRRKYLIKTTERCTKILLRDFCDSGEITDHTHEVELKLWVSSPYTSDEECVAICKIPNESGKPEPISPPVDIEPLIESVETKTDPLSRRGCATCDHARTVRGSYWCRRYHWPRVVEWIFDRDYSQLCCPEWRGEYFDKEGKYHSN